MIGQRQAPLNVLSSAAGNSDEAGRQITSSRTSRNRRIRCGCDAEPPGSAPSPAGCRPSGDQRDAEDTAKHIGLATVVEGLDVVGSAVRTCQLKLPGATTSWVSRASLHHNFVFFLDRPPGAGWHPAAERISRVRLVHLRLRSATASKSRSSKVRGMTRGNGAGLLQAGSNVQLDGADLRWHTSG